MTSTPIHSSATVTTPEAQLLLVEAWARAGDEAAARALMEALHPRVAAIVRHHLPPREAAEDLVQEVFVKVFRNLGNYRRDLPLEHWVSRIAANTCVDRLRAHRRRPELRWSDLSPAHAAALAESLRAPDGAEMDFAPRAASELLEKLLPALGPAERLIFNLHYIEQRPLAEIATITGQSGVAVRVRLFRARGKLKNALRALERTLP